MLCYLYARCSPWEVCFQVCGGGRGASSCLPWLFAPGLSVLGFGEEESRSPGGGLGAVGAQQAQTEFLILQEENLISRSICRQAQVRTSLWSPCVVSLPVSCHPSPDPAAHLHLFVDRLGATVSLGLFLQGLCGDGRPVQKAQTPTFVIFK